MFFSEKDIYIIACIRDLNSYDTPLYAGFAKMDCLGSDFSLKSVDHCHSCKPATIIIMMQLAQQDQIPSMAGATG